MTIKQCALAVKGGPCRSEFQDQRYGPGMRVHTVGKAGDERCTVCSGPARWVRRLQIHAEAHIKTAHG